MATVETVKLTLTLENNKKAVINLPTPEDPGLLDPDNADPMWQHAFDPIVAAYASDTGDSVKAITYDVIETKTTRVFEDYDGTNAD